MARIIPTNRPSPTNYFSGQSYFVDCLLNLECPDNSTRKAVSKSIVPTTPINSYLHPRSKPHLNDGHRQARPRWKKRTGFEPVHENLRNKCGQGFPLALRGRKKKLQFIDSVLSHLFRQFQGIDSPLNQLSGQFQFIDCLLSWLSRHFLLIDSLLNQLVDSSIW